MAYIGLDETLKHQKKAQAIALAIFFTSVFALAIATIPTFSLMATKITKPSTPLIIFNILISSSSSLVGITSFSVFVINAYKKHQTKRWHTPIKLFLSLKESRGEDLNKLIRLVEKKILKLFKKEILNNKNPASNMDSNLDYFFSRTTIKFFRYFHCRDLKFKKTCAPHVRSSVGKILLICKLIKVKKEEQLTNEDKKHLTLARDLLSGFGWSTALAEEAINLKNSNYSYLLDYFQISENRGFPSPEHAIILQVLKIVPFLNQNSNIRNHNAFFKQNGTNLNNLKASLKIARRRLIKQKRYRDFEKDIIEPLLEAANSQEFYEKAQEFIGLHENTLLTKMTNYTN